MEESEEASGRGSKEKFVQQPGSFTRPGEHEEASGISSDSNKFAVQPGDQIKPSDVVMQEYREASDISNYSDKFGMQHGGQKNLTEAATLTDLCCSSDLAEVELVSLLEESIPKYKLRVDSITNFTGYENQDFGVPYPALPPSDSEQQLSPVMMRETFNYLLLSGKRVSQMTRTFNDIEAVTRLLEEKEKDLELTARIGQELLTHSNQLEAQVAALEAQLKEEQDKLVQTQHELTRKTELLAVLSAEEDSGDPSTPTSSKNILHEILSKKVQTLEQKNQRLKEKMAQLSAETCEAEEKEKTLIKDMTQQLGMASRERANISDELVKLREEHKYHLTEIQSKTDQIYILESANLDLATENANITTQLTNLKQTQELLCTEILELKEQYTQVVGLLSDSREQVRTLSKRHLPSTHLQSANKTPAVESERPLMSFQSMDSGFAVEKPSYRRVFETVRSASRSSSSTHGSNGPSPANQMFGSQMPASNTFLTSASGHSPRMSPASLHSNNSPFRPPLVSQMALSTPPLRSLVPQGLPSLSQEMGLADTQPGASVNQDSIDWSLDRGSPCLQLLEMDIDSYDCRTPESIMSTGSSSGASNASWRLRQKLQIIKPLEGSATLHHWSQLARPNLGSALKEQSPCVLAKGQSSSSEVDPTQYSLEDLEEDEPQVVNPGKQFEPSGHTFTLTNSTVLHPEERSIVTSSCLEPQFAVTVPGCSSSSSRPASPPIPGTPGQQPRRDSTVTFSMNLGLAKGLNERGTGAAGSSPNSSSCVTPCNSPERPASPQGAASSSFFLSRILAQGSEKLGWLQATESPRTPKKEAYDMLRESLANINLMNRIAKAGIDNMLRSRAESNVTLRSDGPMSQLLGRRARLGQSSLPASPSTSADNRSQTPEAHSAPQTPFKSPTAVKGREVRRDLGSVQTRSVPPVNSSISEDKQSLSSGAIINFVLLGRKGGLF